MSRTASRRARPRRYLSTFGVALAAAVSWMGAASAASLGSLGPFNLGGCTSCSVIQLKTGAHQPRYVVPAGMWKITSWRTVGGGQATGQARMQIYRPTRVQGQFKLIAQTDVEAIRKTRRPAFAVNINVRAGDVLGFRTEHDVAAGYPSGTGNDVGIVSCEPTVIGTIVGEGTSCPINVLAGDLANVKAVIVPLQ